MFNKRNFSLLFVLFLFVGYISATPVPAKKSGVKSTKGPATKSAALKRTTTKGALSKKAPSCPIRKLHKRADNLLIGYKGIKDPASGQPRVSGGGELGDVFYVADAVDLAYSFAKGPKPDLEQICEVYVDRSAWMLQPKVWVPPAAIAKGSTAMNSQYVGSVLFASHTNAGLRTGSPSAVWQLGIRQAQFTRLGLTVDCRPKQCYDYLHNTLNYPGLTTQWNIHRA